MAFGLAGSQSSRLNAVPRNGSWNDGSGPAAALDSFICVALAEPASPGATAKSQSRGRYGSCKPQSHETKTSSFSLRLSALTGNSLKTALTVSGLQDDALAMKDGGGEMGAIETQGAESLGDHFIASPPSRTLRRGRHSWSNKVHPNNAVDELGVLQTAHALSTAPKPAGPPR